MSGATGTAGDDSSVLLGISAAGTPRVAADGAALRPVLDGCRPMGALGAQEEGRTDTPGVPQPTPPAPGTQPLALTAGPTPGPGAPREATAAAGKRRPVRAQRGPSHHGAATRSAAPRAVPCRAVPAERCRSAPTGGAESRGAPAEADGRRAEPQAPAGGRRREAWAARRQREEGRERPRGSPRGSPRFSLRAAPSPRPPVPPGPAPLTLPRRCGCPR